MHNEVSIIARLTVVRPFCNIGSADDILIDRPHSVNALLGDAAGALHAVAREEDLSAAVTNDKPYRRRVADACGNLRLIDIVGIKIAFCDDLVKLAGICPVGIGGQDLDLRAAEIIENGRGIVRMIMHLDALAVRMELRECRVDAGAVFRIAVRKILGERIMGREHYGVDGESGIADDVFDRTADVVDMIMRDEPIEMQNVHARRLAERKKGVKREGGFGHSAVVEDIVTVERKYESVRLGYLGMSKGNNAKHVVTEREIAGERAVHFILFISGVNNSRLEVRGQRAEGRGQRAEVR